MSRDTAPSTITGAANTFSPRRNSDENMNLVKQRVVIDSLKFLTFQFSLNCRKLGISLIYAFASFFFLNTRGLWCTTTIHLMGVVTGGLGNKLRPTAL